MPSAGEEVTERLLARARERLEPQGWRVEFGFCTEHAVNFGFEHELSTYFGCGFNPQSPEVESKRFLERFLARREFQVIAQRPAEAPHASLMQRFRQAAQANRWSTDVLAIVARVLRHERLLTDEEAEWLEYAGPAWHEDGKCDEAEAE